MREQKLMIRLSEDEKRELEERAEEAGLKGASWARMTLLRAARERELEGRARVASSQADGPGLLSLFSGSGGLDEGFRQAGFNTLIAVDNDPDAVATFEHNHRGAVARKGDVSKLTLTSLDEFYGKELAPVGVIGGPPCQSFSVSNVHQSDDDPRHRLPEAYASLLAALNRRHPISFFVFENVPGLLGKKHLARYEHFKHLFAQAGFKVYEQLLDAKYFDVPQERPRIFIVGVNKALHPEAAWEPPEESDRILTVRDAIAGLPEPVFNDRGLDADTFPVHPNHWSLVPRSEKFRNGSLKEGEMYGRSFRTLWWDRPSWTVAYGHREVHVHPEGHRRLSIYEAMLLQSFPKEYRLLGNMTAQVKLVSDAVPPGLALKLAKSIRKSLGI